MSPGDAGDGDEHAELQRRTLVTLRLAQVPAQAGVAASVAVVTLLAGDVLGSDRWAGLGGAAFTIGSALTAVPLALAMRHHGRRPALATAFGVASIGAAVAATGGQLRWFPVLVVGLMLFGAAQAASLQQRYVAADLAPARQQARAIAAIVWVGTLGAVAGPVLTPVAKDVGRSLGLDELIGPYLMGIVLSAVAGVVILIRLRPDPLVVAGGVDPAAERIHPLHQVRTSYGVIRRSPGAILGLAAMAGSQAAMVAVMTMTPPHMKDHGHADLSAFVIAVHIVGMYGLAPVVGRLVVRVGAIRAIQLGAVVLATGTVSAVVAGYVPALMFAGLFLLGLGWNIGLIGGTTLLTTSVPPEARVEAQGTGDLTMSLCGAAAAFTSGFVKASFGFHVLADGATALAALLLVAAWIAAARRRAPTEVAVSADASTAR